MSRLDAHHAPTSVNAKSMPLPEVETLRDRFAMAALPSVIAVCGRDTRDADVGYPQHCATKAYEIADAMMEARK